MYALKRWAVPETYLNDGRAPVDNTRCEQMIRPVVQGRRTAGGVAHGAAERSGAAGVAAWCARETVVMAGSPGWMNRCLTAVRRTAPCHNAADCAMRLHRMLTIASLFICISEWGKNAEISQRSAGQKTTISVRITQAIQI